MYGIVEHQPWFSTGNSIVDLRGLLPSKNSSKTDFQWKWLFPDLLKNIRILFQEGPFARIDRVRLTEGLPSHLLCQIRGSEDGAALPAGLQPQADPPVPQSIESLKKTY